MDLDGSGLCPDSTVKRDGSVDPMGDRSSATCGAMFLGMLGALGYAVYRTIMWLSTQTS